MIVIDDMALEATDDTAKLFTVGSHHLKLNVIFISHNKFPKYRAFCNISLNTTYLALFKNVNDNLQSNTFASRYLPGNNFFYGNI